MKIIKKTLLTRYYLQQAVLDGDAGILMEVRFDFGVRNILTLNCIPQRYGPDLRQLTVTTQATRDGVKWEDVKIYMYKAFVPDDCSDEYDKRMYGYIIRRMMHIPDGCQIQP